MSGGTEIADLKAMLVERLDELLGLIAPGVKRRGREWRGASPLSAGGGDAFRVLAHGGWCDFASGEKGDVLQLVAAAHGVDGRTKEGVKYACQWARRWLGLGDVGQEDLDRRRALAREKQAAREAAEAAARERVAGRVREIVEGAMCFAPGVESPVEKYLAQRRVPPAGVPGLLRGVLRARACLDGWADLAGHEGPAMVAPVVVDGRTTGVHATWLREWDGRWLKISDSAISPSLRRRKAKLMLGETRGGIVPLTLGASGKPARTEDGAGPVVLAEGIETALSCAKALPDARVWACLSLGGIGRAPVHLPGVTSVIVALENDVKPAALDHRARALEMLEAAGKPVAVMRPPPGASDFNDVEG